MGAPRQRAEQAIVPNIERLLVVVNERAGGVRRHGDVAERLRRVAGERGRVVETRELAEMVAAIAEARVEGVDTVAICGGDGTNLHVLTAIANAWRNASWPRIVLLAGGSVNTAARNLDATGAPEKRLERLLNGPLQVRKQPLLKVNGRTGFMFGSHMVARVMDAYYAGRTGPVGCALLAAHIVGSSAIKGRFARHLFEPDEAEITIDGQDLGVRPLTSVMAAVVASPAVGIRATHRAGEDGGFHLIATSGGPRPVFQEVGRLWTGLPVRALSLDVVAKSATLTARGELRYTLDGDMFAAKKVQMTATAPVEILEPARD